MASTELALRLLRTLPRVSLRNIRDLPEGAKLRKKKQELPRGKHAGKHAGQPPFGQGSRMSLPRLGFEGGQTPFYIQVPIENYYAGHQFRPQHIPLSLLQLQKLIDLGRVDPNEPIDLTTITNTKVIKLNPFKRHYGINLTDEGADCFSAKVNIEVQHADSEVVVAAIEKNGGVLTTRYYDPRCVMAMIDPKKFFDRGVPIPRCATPPQSVLERYMDATRRGYLADPDAIRLERVKLAQKYGYKLVDIESDPLAAMLKMRKDPRQIWFGLEPGWVVNVKDRIILKTSDEDYQSYYKS